MSVSVSVMDKYNLSVREERERKRENAWAMVSAGLYSSCLSVFMYFRLSVGGPVFLRKPACVFMLECA